MLMSEVDKLFQLILWKQRERPASEFEAIDVVAHTETDQLRIVMKRNPSYSRLENILEVSLSHNRVIRPSNLSHTHRSRLWWAVIMTYEAETPFFIF